ncbi:MAG: GC-type dockerin domain-anchored protein [Phycisphaerales bacterium]
MHKHLAIGSVACFAALASAQQIQTRAELTAFLDDAQLLEEFEDLNLAGGTVENAPNPLNSDTTPMGWGILPGASYATDGVLKFVSGFLHGDDSVILDATNGLTMTFDEPQAAIGFDAVNTSGNVTRTYTVRFMHNDTQLGQIVQVLGPGSDYFLGWQNTSVGITEIRITATATGSTGPVVFADNVEWGVTVDQCLADLTGDGVLDFFDVSAFLNAFGSMNPLADFTGDGAFDFFDVSAFLSAFSAGCP